MRADGTRPVAKVVIQRVRPGKVLARDRWNWRCYGKGNGEAKFDAGELVNPANNTD